MNLKYNISADVRSYNFIQIIPIQNVFINTVKCQVHFFAHCLIFLLINNLSQKILSLHKLVITAH
jgi:hypothetical protein